MPRHVAGFAQSDLFAVESSFPEGFVYYDDLTTVAEERILLKRLKNLPFKPFEFHGFLSKRRVVSFGFRFDYTSQVLCDRDPIPSFLLGLRTKAVHLCSCVAR